MEYFIIQMEVKSTVIGQKIKNKADFYFKMRKGTNLYSEIMRNVSSLMIK